jgi:hypothetical protein
MNKTLIALSHNCWADRILYVALPDFVYNRIIKYDWAREVIEDLNMKFILYDTNLKSIVAGKD